MNYTESLAYLDSLGKFGIKLGMERIESLLKELDNPQDKIKTVHVTGTNGKGSVSSMIANILLASNLKVGKFVSPHLVKYNERISINNNDITDDAFALVLTAVKQAAEDKQAAVKASQKNNANAAKDAKAALNDKKESAQAKLDDIKQAAKDKKAAAKQASKDKKTQAKARAKQNKENAKSKVEAIKNQAKSEANAWKSLGKSK